MSNQSRRAHATTVSSLCLLGLLGCQMPVSSGYSANNAPITPKLDATAGTMEAASLRHEMLVDVDPIHGAAFERAERPLQSVSVSGTLKLLAEFPRVVHDTTSGLTTVTLQLTNTGDNLTFLQCTVSGERRVLTPAYPFNTTAAAAGAVQTTDLVFANPGGGSFAVKLSFIGTLQRNAKVTVGPSAAPPVTPTQPPIIPTASPTPLLTASPTPLPTASPTPLPTASPAPLPTASPTPLPTASSAPLPTASSAPLPTASPAPLSTATPAPAGTPAPLPSAGLHAMLNTFDTYTPDSDPVDFIDPNDEGFSFSWMPRVTWRVGQVNGSAQYIHDGLTNIAYLNFRRYRGTGMGTPNGLLPAHYLAELDVTPLRSYTYAPTGDQGTQVYYVDPTHYFEVLIKPTSFQVWACDNAAPFQSVGWHLLYQAPTTTIANQTRHLGAEVDCIAHTLKAYLDGQLMTTIDVNTSDLMSTLLTNQPHWFAMRGTGNIVAHDNVHLQPLP